MRLNQIISYLISQLIGRLLSRVLAAAVIGLSGLIALYQFIVVGTLALETQVGFLYAHLIIGGMFAVTALAGIIALVATRARRLRSARTEEVLDEPRITQLAMLIEAVLLGYYSLSKKTPRS